MHIYLEDFMIATFTLLLTVMIWWLLGRVSYLCCAEMVAFTESRSVRSVILILVEEDYKNHKKLMFVIGPTILIVLVIETFAWRIRQFKNWHIKCKSEKWDK